MLEEESEYSYVDSEYMSDEEMLMQEFPDNPTYAQLLLEAIKSMNPKVKTRQTNYDMGKESLVNSKIKSALKKLEGVKLALKEIEAELEGEMDEDDFEDELDEGQSIFVFVYILIPQYKSL